MFYNCPMCKKYKLSGAPKSRVTKNLGGEKATEDIQEESSLKKAKERNHTTWNVLQSKRMLPKAGLCGWLPRVCQQRKNNRMRVISLELTHVSSEATSFVLVCSVCRSSGLFSSLVVQGWTKVTEASVCIYANAYIYIYIWICTKCRMWLCRYVYVNV